MAVLGASPHSAYSSDLPRNLDCSGYSGDVYRVNPNRDEVMGLSGYASLREIPGVVDLAVASIPRAAVSDALREAGEVGVPPNPRRHGRILQPAEGRVMERIVG